MSYLAYIIQGLATVLGMGLDLYMWVIIIRALISWVNPDPYNPIVMFLYKATEPVLYRVRRTLSLHRFGIDISPIIVIFAIVFLKVAVVQSLMKLSTSLM